MILGKKPVLEQGHLSIWKRSLDPVPAGQVVLLSGNGSTIELTEGQRTDFDLRRRYPVYTVVDVGASEIEFSQEYRTRDFGYCYRITIKATARVANAQDFIRNYGVDAQIGAPLADHWKTRISDLVNLRGGAGLEDLQNFILEIQKDVQAKIAQSATVAGGIQLLGCTFDAEETESSVIYRELHANGRAAVASLNFRFPDKAAEIDRWASKVEEIRQLEIKIATDNIAFSETRIRTELSLLREMIDMGLVDPDRALPMLSQNAPSPDGTPGLLMGSHRSSDPKRLQGSSQSGEETET